MKKCSLLLPLTLPAMAFSTWAATSTPTNLSPVYGYQNDNPSAATPPVATTPVEKPAGTSVLPFLSDEARKRGYELPEPFGININYMNIGQNINVDSINFNGLALGHNGQIPLDNAFKINVGHTVKRVRPKRSSWMPGCCRL
ncbi:Uncharacterised protein [Salmonella enterica subsp. houtenae]|nr:Uncharacterised protein [Salmonella enterica subsp. houtenae]